MGFVDLDSIDVPANGSPVEAAWGVAAAENDRVLWAGMAQSWAPYDPALTLVNAAGDLEVEGYTHRIGYNATGQFAYRFGSTTTYSSGTVEFDLPFTSGLTGAFCVGEWCGYDTSAGDYIGGLVIIKASSTTVGQLVHDAPASNGGLVSNTVPWSWAAGDELSVSFNYNTSTAPTGALV